MAAPDLPITLFADDSASSLQKLRDGKALVVDFCARAASRRRRATAPRARPRAHETHAPPAPQGRRAASGAPRA